jgi:8-oxo-dGTP pyrophosphatase MutT (NUDIX family)
MYSGSRHYHCRVNMFAPAEVAAGLRPILAQSPGELPEGFGRPAGVLVPLIAGPEPLSLVFTERHADLSRHAGEISFPGGMPDPDDDDLRHTALREANEEIGLDPGDVEVLGVLPPLPTFVTEILIVPYVGLLHGRPEFVPSPSEIESIIEAPLAHLDRVEAEVEYDFEGRIWIGNTYDVDGKVIWGATGKILKGFLDLLRKEAPWMLRAPAA